MKSFGLVLVLPKVGTAFSGQVSVPTLAWQQVLWAGYSPEKASVLTS